MHHNAQVVALIALLTFIPGSPGHEGQRVSAPVSSIAVSGQDADISLIDNRLTALYIDGASSGSSRYLAAQTAAGSWKDIDYNDHSNSWPSLKHLNRIQEMVIAYRSANSPARHSIELLHGITNGLGYWLATKPVSTNWWFNEIGQQLALERILILMKSDLPEALVQAGGASLHDPDHTSLKPAPTGQNLIWFAEEELVRGVLRGSGDDIANAGRAIESVLAVTTAEGIQPDYSFHQHGPQLYVGGYGLGALQDTVTYAAILEGTRFAFAPASIDTASTFLLQGTRPMVRGKMLDYGAIGREISRPEGGEEGLRLTTICEVLAQLRPENASEYILLERHIQGTGASYGFLGHKHFWNSDFTMHEREGYYTSVKMTSVRTHGTESLNGENLKGFWLPFGVNYVARRGDEYAGIFPVWDWAHLPGTTSPYEVPSLGSYVNQSNGFVGGVSDGKYGASAMLLDLESGPSIHAHKSWFFFDDEFVALGSGISSMDPVSVNTTLNQCLLRGEVVVDSAKVPIGVHSLSGVSWVLHDGVGYVFPAKARIELKNDYQNGSWASINSLQRQQPITDNVFTLWLDHGVRPTNAKYEYIVVPDTDTAQLEAYVKNDPVRVVANTLNVQAVINDKLEIAEMVFYTQGHVDLENGIEVGVDQPCMVMLEENGNTDNLTVSSPEGPLQVHVTVSAPSRKEIVAFDLPGGEVSGTSQTKLFQ